MKQYTVIGNWKMNPQTFAEARTMFVRAKKTAEKLTRTNVAVCPPFVYLYALKKLATKRCSLGAQDVFWEKAGAYTGEVSALSLVDAGARFVIVGHSERRVLGETDDDVGRKLAAALRERIAPVLCVGEQERDERGEYTKWIVRQLKHALRGVKREHLPSIFVAYEPVWAIGARARRAASPGDVLEASILIRKTIAGMYGNNSAHAATLLYGGSVDDRNARDFVREGNMNGLLVGRASTDPDTFSRIMMSLERR